MTHASILLNDFSASISDVKGDQMKDVKFMLVRIQILLILVVSVHIANAQDHDRQDANGPLISVSELQAKLGKTPSLKIVDVGQDREEYAKAHIPGAMFVHWIDDIIQQSNTERYNLVGQDEMQALLRRLGITRNDHIVLYDNLSSRLATRLYWSLKVYDHPHVHVLNGGLQAWLNNDGALTTELPNIMPSNYAITKVNQQMSVDMAFIEDHLRDPKVALIDGRPPKQYSGEELGRVFHTGTPHKLRGHIPGAVNVFWKDNFNQDGTFKSVDELRTLYKQAGIEAGKSDTIVTYCNEGLHAAPPWFVLRELLGVKDVRIYDDSMGEWANSDQPVDQSPTQVITAP